MSPGEDDLCGCSRQDLWYIPCGSLEAGPGSGPAALPAHDTEFPVEALLLQHGYPALFLLSFLAATVIPLGSEWLLLALLLEGADPVLAVTTATAGNTLGACTTYWIGLKGGPFLIGRVLRLGERELAGAHRFYDRYGSWSLLFSWLPVVGDPLCLVGGVLRVGVIKFLLLVLTGKLARYTVISLLTLHLL